MPLLDGWLKEAFADIRNAHAMTLATVDPEGRPTARMVICRGIDVRMEYFGPALPTSTTVEVRRLAHPDFLVEVEVVAMLG